MIYAMYIIIHILTDILYHQEIYFILSGQGKLGEKKTSELQKSSANHMNVIEISLCEVNTQP